MKSAPAAIAFEVLQTAHDLGLARSPMPDDPAAHIESMMFDPRYDTGAR